MSQQQIKKKKPISNGGGSATGDGETPEVPAVDGLLAKLKATLNQVDASEQRQTMLKKERDCGCGGW